MIPEGFWQLSGVDTSSKAVDIVTVAFLDHQPLSLSVTEIASRKSDGHARRIEIGDRLEDWLAVQRPVGPWRWAIEEPLASIKNGKTTLSLNAAWGVYHRAAFKSPHVTEIGTVNNMTWKKTIIGKGNPYKKEDRSEISEFVQERYGFNDSGNFDASDAFCVLLLDLQETIGIPWHGLH